MKRLAVGILAHVDAGKTTLSEAMLYAGGMIRHLGRVDKGDAFLDTYELEKKRGITIFSKQARLAWDDMDVTLLDTPGHVDFSAEMERVLPGAGLCGAGHQRFRRRAGAYKDAVAGCWRATRFRRSFLSIKWIWRRDGNRRSCAT